MNYSSVIKGTFLSRPNRFLALVRLDGGREVSCHVKNTGRCRELFIPGVPVILQHHPEAAVLGRKTEYSLIAVRKKTAAGETLVNIDSQIPNAAAGEWLTKLGAGRIFHIKREVAYGNSRFDLSFDIACEKSPGGTGQTSPGAGGSQKLKAALSAPVETKRAFMEVKGVTLEQEGIAKFPDAPTQRGVKHVLELAEASSRGLRAYLLFVVQMKGVRLFTPNMDTHPEFGEALIRAYRAGVRILARDCLVTETSLFIDSPVPIWLPGFKGPIHQGPEHFI